ncbi:helix-turn-helix domain-containing protein [Streptomyces sp. 8N616]|uniref:helix-turn-helix domain-containing protein n=1 Tax=Streptomyces sp. 8N616 TaxID=3457414 RepID=UPI003FD2D88E
MTQRGFDSGYDEDDVPEWADKVMATVAAEVRRRRKELRMSAQDLADRCEEIGYPIPRNVIANMESGRRSTLPLVDVMVLARALNTSPICLIYPVGYIDRVQPLPDQDITETWNALEWFTGEGSQLGLEVDMLSYYREHVEAERAALSAMSLEDWERWRAENASNPSQRAEALEAQARHAKRAESARQRLRVARSFIRRDGGRLPLLPSQLSDIDPPATTLNETKENKA